MEFLPKCHKIAGVSAEGTLGAGGRDRHRHSSICSQVPGRGTVGCTLVQIRIPNHTFAITDNVQKSLES